MAALPFPPAPAFVAGLRVPCELPVFPHDDAGTTEQVPIEPANMGQLVQLLAHAGDLLDVVAGLQPERAARLQAGQPSFEDLDVLLTLLQDKGPVAIDLVAIASGIAVERVKSLAPDRFAWLFGVVVMVNADFFSRSRGAFAAAGALFAQARGTMRPPPTGPASSPP